MNRSIEFVKSKIINNETNGIQIDGWDDSLILNPIDYYMRFIPDLNIKNGNELFVTMKYDNGKQSKITIIYDPDIDFDYFTMETTTHDGTMLFTLESIKDLLYKLLQLNTMPKDTPIDENNVDDYDYVYTIGDIVLHRDFGIKSINGHNRMAQTDTIILPIKFDCIKQK